MEEKIFQQLKTIKEEIVKKKAKLHDISNLVNIKIDREYGPELWKFSERELDIELGNRLKFLYEDIDPRPNNETITSHRKYYGPIIIFFKRILLKITSPLINIILTRQQRFNLEQVAFDHTAIVRFRMINSRLSELEQQFFELEEHQEQLTKLIIHQKKNGTE